MARPSLRRAVAGMWIPLGIGLSVFGMSMTDDIPEDREHTRRYAEQWQWPAGTIDLVNDELRISGWHFFFSELPNDVNSFGFRCEDTRDANRLIGLLAKIKAPNLVLQLSPNSGRTRPLEADGPRFMVTFEIGSQKVLDGWFSRLKFESAPASTLPSSQPSAASAPAPRRIFGVHRYEKVPTAMPPTLTLYLAHDIVVLDELKIPDNVTVVSAVREQDRKLRPDDPVIITIERFVEEWSRRHATTRPAASQATASPAASRPG